MDYLHVQEDNPWYNYYLNNESIGNNTYKMVHHNTCTLIVSCDVTIVSRLCQSYANRPMCLQMHLQAQNKCIVDFDYIFSGKFVKIC